MVKKLITAGLLVLALVSTGAAIDFRAVKLKKFLERYPGSPLVSHTQEIVHCADRFGLDYRLYVAISGAESGYGRHYPKNTYNLTGISNGRYGFRSIYGNIYYTHRLLATTKWYHKYRRTGELMDLIYVYKAVPPYDRYLRILRYAMHEIAFVSIEKEKKEWLAKINSPAYKKSVRLAKQTKQLADWGAIRYDQHQPGKPTAVF
ncbi:MAG: hypothetical protein WC632_00300 [Candidatus Margulisiibacteriota bacterium]